MKRLIIGEIPDQFNKTTDHILSTFSLINQETDLINIQNNGISPFSESCKTTKNKEALRHFIRAFILPKLSKALNQYHHRNNSRDFWLELCNPWLEGLVENTWYYYQIIQRFISTYKEDAFYVLLYKPESPWNFKNNADLYQRGYFQKEFHFWIASVITKQLAPDHWQFEWKTFIPKQKQGLNGALSHIHLRMMPMTGVSKTKSLLYSLILEAKPSLESYSKETIENTNSSIQTSIPEAFQKIILYCLDVTLPRSIKEDLSTYEKSIRNIQIKPGKYRIMPESIHDEITTLKAHCKEEGEHCYQIPKLDETITEHKSRLFPHPQLRAIYNKHHDKTETLSIHVPGWPIPHKESPIIEVLQNYEDIKGVLSSLSPRSLQSVAITKRTHNEISLSASPLLARQFPHIKNITYPYQDTKDIISSKLHIFTSISSLMSLTISSGAPFILLLTKAQKESGPIATLLDQFKSSELLFTDPYQCAKKIESIWPNIKEWYESHHELRLQWLNLVENFSKSQSIAMAKTLWTLH